MIRSLCIWATLCAIAAAQDYQWPAAAASLPIAQAFQAPGTVTLSDGCDLGGSLAGALPYGHPMFALSLAVELLTVPFGFYPQAGTTYIYAAFAPDGTTDPLTYMGPRVSWAVPPMLPYLGGVYSAWQPDSQMAFVETLDGTCLSYIASSWPGPPMLVAVRCLVLLPSLSGAYAAILTQTIAVQL